MTTNRQKAWTIACVAILLICYGVPLARAYFQAREIKGDKRLLAEMIKFRVEHERGSMAPTMWMVTLCEYIGGPETRDYIIARSATPNHVSRAFAVHLLMQYYRDDPMAQPVIRKYLLNPREMMWTRYMPLNFDFPELKKTDTGKAALALIEQQRELFPEKGYFPD